jgi:predicted dehydrogenase
MGAGGHEIGRQTPGLADPFLILVRTADGSLSTVEVFLTSSYGYDIRCDAVCETGVLTVTEPAKLLVNANLATSSPIAADWRPRFADAASAPGWVDSVEGRLSTWPPGGRGAPPWSARRCGVDARRRALRRSGPVRALPEPRPVGDVPSLRWGILGTGWIAQLSPRCWPVPASAW